MVLNRSYELALAVRRFRRWRTNARLHSIIKWNQLQHFQTDDWSRSEVRARDLARRLEESIDWLPRPILPAGGAAGPLLVYLLLRALTELDVANVLELGCGQSTEIFGAWARQSSGRHVVSLEHDAFWAERMRNRVVSEQVRVLSRPLVTIAAPNGQLTEWYESPAVEQVPKAGFGLVLVDGPHCTRRFSRVGIVDHLPDWLAENWAIIWDDLDRPADLESFAYAVSKLRKLGRPHDHVLLDGDRTVGIIYSPANVIMRCLW